MKFRIEITMGEVQVPADKYWGAQTERSRNNFKIGPSASMPNEIMKVLPI
jgi:fumarate hydratase class II